MNPDITIKRAPGIDVHFLLASNPMPRVTSTRRPAAAVNRMDAIETAADAAEQDRQDSFAFLHKLVMG
jgi:hypothetical protein